MFKSLWVIPNRLKRDSSDHVPLAARALPAATKRYTAPIWKMVVRNYLYFQALSQHLRQVYQAQGDFIAIYVYPAGISF
jgi:hypothetical protein